MRWNYYKLRQLSLLQSAMDSYYKLRQLFYYKVRHGLLQIATGITKCDGFITNCDRYYKVRWLLQIATVQVLSLSTKKELLGRGWKLNVNLTSFIHYCLGVSSDYPFFLLVLVGYSLFIIALEVKGLPLLNSGLIITQLVIGGPLEITETIPPKKFMQGKLVWKKKKSCKQWHRKKSCRARKKNSCRQVSWKKNWIHNN